MQKTNFISKFARTHLSLRGPCLTNPQIFTNFHNFPLPSHPATRNFSSSDPNPFGGSKLDRQAIPEKPKAGALTNPRDIKDSHLSEILQDNVDDVPQK